MLKTLRNALDVILLLLSITCLIGLMGLRWYATQIIHIELSFVNKALYFAPSLLFYSGIFLWLITLSAPYFQKGGWLRWFIFLYLLILMGLDAISSVFIRGAGDWFNLYTLYYMQTQFNSLTMSYERFQLLFILFVPVSLTALLTLKLLWAIHKKQKNLIKLAVASFMLLACSFISFTPSTPKSLTLSALSYTISSLKNAPSSADFSNAPTNLQQPVLNGQISNKLNVVLIIMESTRKSAISFYNPELKRKTSFFDDLAEQSIVFNNMYTVMPFTFKAMVNMNCGFTSYIHMQFHESVYGLPGDCLGQWFKQNAYHTMFMQSSSVSYGNINTLAQRLGFDEAFSSEHFDKENFKQSFLDSSEDSIMFKPNNAWLQQAEQPFYAMYLTYSPHWPYNFYDKDDYVQYIDDDVEFIFNFKKELNNYLNAVHTQDQFIQQLIEQYKEAGLYENSIFIFIADHGQGFGENFKHHYQHGNNLYQEGLTIPFMIHAPNLIKNAELRNELLKQTDLPLIIQNLLEGKDVVEGIHNEKVFSVCWYWKWCVARTDKQYKYIHNFDDSPDELYDLQKDPNELNNIAIYQPELIQQFKQETLNWYYQQLAAYSQLYSSQDPKFYIRGFIAEPKDVTLKGLINTENH